VKEGRGQPDRAQRGSLTALARAAEIKQTVRKLGVSRYIASQSDDFGDFSDSEGL
jgi:hypothetical protein